MCKLVIQLRRYEQNLILADIDVEFTALFLEHWMLFYVNNVRLERYGKKLLFYGFEINFTELSVLFLEHWRLYFVDCRYGYKDTWKTFYSLALKLNLQHY